MCTVWSFSSTTCGPLRVKEWVVWPEVLARAVRRGVDDDGLLGGRLVRDRPTEPDHDDLPDAVRAAVLEHGQRVGLERDARRAGRSDRAERAGLVAGRPGGVGD